MVIWNMFITHEYRFSVSTKSDGCSLEFDPNLLAMFWKSLKMWYLCVHKDVPVISKNNHQNYML